MREFFKAELKNLHLTTGLQQYFKLSQMPDSKEQIKMLLDLLVKECGKFPLISEEDKKTIIQTYMIQDAEFQGFNPKILWKWFNIENRKYLPQGQSQFDDRVVERVVNTPEQQAAIDALLVQWKEDLAKIGNPEPRTDGIKDQRIQQMRDSFNSIECRHTGLRVPVGEGVEVCNDCGKEFKV